VNATATIDTRPIESDVQVALVTAQGLAVTDAPSYELAGRELLTLARAERRITDWFLPLKNAAHRAWKVLCDREREVLAPLQAEITRVKRERVVWKSEDDRRRRLEEQRLAEEQRQRAQELAARQAAALESRGQHARAEGVLERAIAAPPPAVVLPDVTPKVAGISQRQVWKWRVVDEALVPREYLRLDDVKIGGVVRAMKSTCTIPGIEIYAEMDESVRRT
jgi:hypothetical protein